MPLAFMAALALAMLSGRALAQDSANSPKACLLSESISPQTPEGLRGLFAAGIIEGLNGIAAKRLFLFVAQGSNPPLTVREAYAYRSRESVAVALRLRSPAGATEWKAGQAMLRQMVTGAELPRPQVWQAEAVGPGKFAWVVVEIAATEEQAQGTYTLVLWETAGTRPVTLEGVTFP